MRHQTAREVQRDITKLVDRDGRLCLYCSQELDPLNCDIDHLDNNPYNNDIRNKILSHHKCNLDKRDNTDYQILADEKLKANMRNTYHAIDDQDRASPEIQHNVKVGDFVDQKLYEYTTRDGFILWQDALNGFTHLARKKFRHASQVTIRRILDDNTSIFGDYKKEANDDGELIITKRLT